jgi:hypothetical protein
MNPCLKEFAMHRRALSVIAAVLCTAIVAGHRLHAERPALLAPFEVLLGEWDADEDKSGATGGFTFVGAVENGVVVRTNYSNTAAKDGKPASRHDDIMTIYVDGTVVKADYIDSEGDVIRYTVHASGGEMRFVSELQPSEPRYRLTYTNGTVVGSARLGEGSTGVRARAQFTLHPSPEQERLSQSGKIVFASETIENIPPGYRARESYTKLGPDAFEEHFELAEPDKPPSRPIHERASHACHKLTPRMP